MPLTSQQAQQLEVRSHTQLSPYLEICCLRVSANVSYEHAAEDIAYFTGVEVPRSVQQRLVHRQEFSLATVEPEVKELSADGGNIRLRTPNGELCKWEGYKAVCLHELAVAATCKDNPQLIEWVQRQPLAATVTCLGDGHDGIWNLIQPMLPDSQRREVLDWFHLMENLAKVGGSLKRLNQARTLLWQGKVDEAQALFIECKRKTCPTTFASIWTNIVIASSITNTTKPSKSVQLVPGQSNPRSSRLTVAPRFLVLNGSARMFHKFWHIAAPI